jgi:hypothetical protein
MSDPIPPDLKPGYNYDPYKDEGGEVDDFLSKILNKYTGAGGLLSTWRERHIAISGIWAGLRAAQFADIPDCPPLWMDEVQYYRGAALISNVAKIYGTSAIATLTGAFIALKTAGII